jgi:2-phosphosulfolactate phosphatase
VQINVLSSTRDMVQNQYAHKTVIVVDVLRATSVMVTALAHGCRGVIPVESIREAEHLKQPGDLLGGERGCRLIPGFDFGNSPLEYQKADIHGKRIIQTTTNGTRAIQKAIPAYQLIAASMLNAFACARAAIEIGRDLVIVCSGTEDHFSLEDGLCAGLLIDEIQSMGVSEIAIDDFGLTMHAAYRQASHQLEQVLMTSANGIKLTKLGLVDDIRYCAAINQFEIVPILCGNMLVRF